MNDRAISIPAASTRWPLAGFRARFLDVLASIYLYNEHRGYTALDRVLEAVRQYCPEDRGFIAAIEKHRADEYKHYVMFRRWFELQGRMPLAVDRTSGHIDRFIQAVFGCAIDELDTAAVTASPEAFKKLARVIMLTEQRGMRQVEVLLRNRHVRSDKVMTRIFTIVERDEPDHWMPYADWLERNGRKTARWRERWADYWIHKSLMLVKLPSLFLDPRTRRMEHWPDEAGALA